MEVEITGIPPLDATQQHLLDAHSLLNVLNVIWGELSLLELRMGLEKEAPLEELRERTQAIVDALTQPASLKEHAARVRELDRTLTTTVEQLVDRFPKRVGKAAVRNVLENLDNILEVVRRRVRELEERAGKEGTWQPHRVSDLEANVREVLAAIEKNSQGRYRIIFNRARKEEEDYYLDLKLEGADGDSILMPPVFIDVMRDLIANARKYCPPGSHITAAVYQDAREFRLVVEDNGPGIPPGEIQSVCAFGVRGSNVTGIRTMGGGFGLTKAFLMTRQHDGRMWIGSQIGEGTRIRIHLPVPAGSAAHDEQPVAS